MSGMLVLHAIGITVCAVLWWLGGWWALGPWLGLGVFSLVIYIRTWTDTPAIWWWPYLVACWPIMWLGGIVHPLN